MCFCRGIEGLKRKHKQKDWEELSSRNNILDTENMKNLSSPCPFIIGNERTWGVV